MSAGLAGITRRIAAAALLATTLASAASEEDPGVWKHYGHACAWSAAGGAIGTGFGLVASLNGNEDTFEASLVAGFMGGYLIGTAFGANTVTPWHEERGSFGLDLLASVGTGVGMVLAGEGLAELTGNEDVLGWSGLAMFGAVPMGAVLTQRLVAGHPPSLGAWHPAGASPRTIGLVASWTLR